MAPLHFSLPFVQSYKPPRRCGNFYFNPLAKEKAVAQDMLRQQHAGLMIEGPIEAEITFMLTMPKSWSKAKRRDLVGKPCLKRIDVDNCLKFLFDSIKEVIIVDDSQIWHCEVSKLWGLSSQTSIVIT